MSVDPSALDAVQDREQAFLATPPDRLTVSPDRLQKPPSPYMLQADSMIAAALVTGLRSDRPGPVIARVTENAFDSVTGRHLLVPQGSLLFGTYDSQVAFGQNSVLQVWTRLILPNGKSVVLERLSSMDTEGHAGLKDEIDHHWSRLVGAAALSSMASTRMPGLRWRNCSRTSRSLPETSEGKKPSVSWPVSALPRCSRIVRQPRRDELAVADRTGVSDLSRSASGRSRPAGAAADANGEHPVHYDDSVPRMALTAANAVRIRAVLTNSGQLDRTTAAKSATGSM